MRDELDSYLGIFSSGGSIPTSLGGYGLGAQQSTTAKPRYAAYPPRQPAGAGNVTPAQVGATALQNFLNALQAWVPKSGRYDAPTQTAWAQYVKVFREPHANISALMVDNLVDSKNVYITAQALKRLSDKAQASGNLRAEVARKIGSTPEALLKPKTVSKPVVSGNTSGRTSGYTTGTAAVQDVLIRLGWKGRGTTKGAISKDLTDGTYGPTVVELWTQSAKKRGLVPTITKASADGTQVSVVENTFLMLKAAADALVPPTPEREKVGGGLYSLGPDYVTTITVERLGEVLGRLTGAKSDTSMRLDILYGNVAKERGLDGRIEPSRDGKKAGVYKPTWDALIVEYDKKAPAPPAPKPQDRSAVEIAMSNVDKVSDTRIEAPVLRDFFNIAIKNGTLKREPFTSDKWSADYAPLIVMMLKVEGPVKQAWEQMLVPGKLVSKQRGVWKLVRLPAAQVASIQKTVSAYTAAQKADTATYVGYTKVNTAKTIEDINKTGVSTKTFNPSGGHKELADAVRTLLENTKTSIGGDLVKVDAAKNVFVKNAALDAVAKANLRASKRLAATESYRKSMVDEALKASSASVTIDQLQQAFKETVKSGKAGANKALYEAVKRTGAFDTATKAAYTELARTLTIGPAVQEFQKLLQKQMGPSFKKDLVKTVRNDVWNEFLTKAVSQTAIKALPVIANPVIAAASAYTARVSEKEDKLAKRAEIAKMLAAAVKQSNSIISILDVQQGLLQMRGLKEVGKAASSVKITGVSDAETRKALFELSGMIFPKGHVPDILWQQYTDAVGIRVSGSKTSAGWNSANYVALPQAVAALLSERAGGWIAKNGLSVLASKLAPVPLQNQELRLRFDKPSVVTVKVPEKRKEEIKFDDNDAKKEAAKKARQLAAYRRKKAREAARKAEAAQAAAAANTADPKAQQEAQKATAEAAVAEKSAQQSETSAEVATQAAGGQAAGGEAAGGEAAGGQAAGGQAAGGQAAGGQGGSVGPISINIPGGGSFTTPGEPAPAPAPTPAPAEPEPPIAPIQAGMGSSWLLMSAFGLGALFLLKNDKKNPQRTAVRGR